MPNKSVKPAAKNLAVNRQAGHLYHLQEKFEAGIELTGTEVKSIREGKANLKDSYGVVKGSQVWLVRCHISPYAAGSHYNHDPLRDRRLLLHRVEIDKVAGRRRGRGYKLIPPRPYFKKNLIQCVNALAKGQKNYKRPEYRGRAATQPQA